MEKINNSSSYIYCYLWSNKTVGETNCSSGLSVLPAPCVCGCSPAPSGSAPPSPPSCPADVAGSSGRFLSPGLHPGRSAPAPLQDEPHCPSNATPAPIHKNQSWYKDNQGIKYYHYDNNYVLKWEINYLLSPQTSSPDLSETPVYSPGHIHVPPVYWRCYAPQWMTPGTAPSTHTAGAEFWVGGKRSEPKIFEEPN